VKEDDVDHFVDIADERRGFADLIDTLSPEELATPSLCRGWTVHDIAAHLVVPLTTGMSVVLFELIRGRGDFDRANLRLTSRMARSSAVELAGLLRSGAGNHFAPPGVGSIAPLMDVVVHGQDARRPLGIVREIPPARLVAILDFLVSRAGRGKGRSLGLRFEASDIGWAHGDGPLVAGTGEAIMMSLAGRRVVLPELSGDGIGEFAIRR
jgi:uncharacterized protein (TIGR03083 family)